MFDFIKKKIKDSIDTIQKKLVREEESELKEEAKREPERADEIRQEIKAVESVIEKRKERVVRPAEKAPEKHGAKATGKPAVVKEEKKRRLLAHRINEADISNIYDELKSALLENNVALSVLEEIHRDLKENLLGKDVSVLSAKAEVEKTIKKSISDILLEYPVDKFLSDIRAKKPYTILFVGVNGAGKTTTLAKLVNFLMKHGMTVVLSASDTFRAASIEQLETHAGRLKVDVVKHRYGADPAAVAFDAIRHANTVGADVVLVDTAGRSDMNKNLMEELKKIKRVSKPDMTIFVGDALTGNDTVNQASIFDKEVGIDASILSKADVDKKGGAVISISYVTKKPIIFLGTGQGYDDLIPFNKERTAKFLLE